MKYILSICFLFFLIAAEAQEDTSKYIKYPNSYGPQYRDIWATRVMRLPDTTGHRPMTGAPGAIGRNTAGTALFIWDGSAWQAITGGGSSYQLPYNGNSAYYLGGDTLYHSLASGTSGGDTTIFNPVIDSTGQSAYRVLYGRGNNHIGSDPLFLYDSIHNKLVINAANFSIGGNNTKLYVNGNSTIGGNLLNNGNTTIRGTATISTTATGAAGTDSVLVQNNGLVKKIAGNSYISPSDTAAMLSTYLRTNIAAATYRTQAQVRTDISLTTTGTSGAATYNNSTGVFNIPQYSGGSSGLNNVYAPLIKSGDTISRRYNILHYGADTAKRFYDFVTTNLSTTVTSATANFVAGDVGKTILINGAGSAGGVLRTTISSVSNSTTIIVALAASATTSGDTTIYGKDNTTPLQNAITACANGGGGSVFAPVGTYLFSSALIAASNAQITIPVGVSGTNNRLVTIFIEGEAVSGGAGAGFAVGFPGPYQTNGTVFYSTISGSGYMPCFIGSADTVNINGNIPHISNIALMMYTNHGASAISMTAINGRKFAKIDVEKCTIGGDIELFRSTSPASSEVAGIIAGTVNNNGENVISENIITGVKYGIVASEHTLLNGNMIYGDLNGLAIPFSYHPISGNSQIFACANEILSPTISIFGMTAGGANVNLLIASEWDTAAALVGTQWYKSVWEVADSAAHLTGAIRINMIGNSALINNNSAPHTFGINTQVLSVSNFANTYTFNNLNDTFYIPSATQTLTLKTTNNTFQNGIVFRDRDVNKFAIRSNIASGTTSFGITDITNSKTKFYIDTTGLMGIGGTANAVSTAAISISAASQVSFNNGVYTFGTPGVMTQTANNPYIQLNSANSRQTAIIFQQNTSNKFQIGMDFANNGTADWYVFDQANSKLREYIKTGVLYLGGDASGSATTAGLNILTTGLVGAAITPTSTFHDGGSFALGYVAKTATYIATATDQTINFTSGTDTLGLPTAVGITGRIYTIVNSGSGTCKINTTSSQTFVNINTAPTILTLNPVGAAAITSYTVMSNGANWIVIGKVKDE